MNTDDEQRESLIADIRASMIKKQIMVILIAIFGGALLGYATHWLAPFGVWIMMWSNNIDRKP